MSADSILTLALQLESSRFNAGLQHSQSLMRSLGAESASLTSVLKQTGVAMTSLVIGNKMVRMFTSSIQAASSAREDLAQFEHVMRNVTKASEDMVKSLTSDAYGRTAGQARLMLMGMTSLAKGMGMTDKAAMSLSGEFSKMAVDIGSFMMKDPDGVMGAFQSALMGNTMALRSYGVFLNETTLKDAIAANAKKGLVFACERQARAHAVLTEAQKQQKDAIGDFAVESQNFGNQLRKFYGNLGELPALFGKGLLEPANNFLKVANSMIDRLREMDESTWKTISTVTALGTALGITLGVYKVGATALTFYTAAKTAATAATAAHSAASGQQAAATAGATAAINAHTAALHANTAARGANSAAGAAGAGAHAMGAAGAGAHAMGAAGAMRNAYTFTPAALPHQSQANLWNTKLTSYKEDYKKATREMAGLDDLRTSLARQEREALFRQNSIITRYRADEARLNEARRNAVNAILARDRQAEIKATRQMNAAKARMAQQQSVYNSAVAGHMASPYTHQLANVDRRRQNILTQRQNTATRIKSLNAARRRNPHLLTSSQLAENRRVRIQNVRGARAARQYNRAARKFSRSPLGLVGRGVGGAARIAGRGVVGTVGAVGQATGITWLLKSFGTQVMKWLPTGIKTWGAAILASSKIWGAGILKSITIALLPVGATIMTILNPIGWATAIVGGIALIGNYLPKLMYKAYDGLMSVFSAENFGKMWEWCKESAMTMFANLYQWLGKGLYGFGQILESVFYTAINAIGNYWRRVIQVFTGGMVDIGKFEYKSSGYLAYEEQKKTNAMQAELDRKKEEQAKIEKRIAEMRGQIVEQERKWIEQEEAILRKRGELAAGRFDTTAKLHSLEMEIPMSETFLSLAETSIQQFRGQFAEVQERLEKAAADKGQTQFRFDIAKETFDEAEAEYQKRKELYEKAKDAGWGNSWATSGVFRDREKKYREAEKQREALQTPFLQAQKELEASGLSLESIEERKNFLEASMTAAMNDKEKYSALLQEQQYTRFDTRFDQIGQMKKYKDKKGGYVGLMSELRNASVVKRQDEIQSEFMNAHKALMEKQREYAAIDKEKDAARAAAVNEELERAKKRVETAKTDYNELQANLSDQRKVREQFEALYKEQQERYKTAQQNLWDFNFDHAGKGVQQQMARSAFFKAHNQFEGARFDDEREKALQDMQSMYSKMDTAVEMPAWNGFIRSTAGAVESDSIAAQELQERILNDFNTEMLDNAKQRLVIQKQMNEALKQMVKHTDPNNQMQPVGGSVWET